MWLRIVLVTGIIKGQRQHYRKIMLIPLRLTAINEVVTGSTKTKLTTNDKMLYNYMMLVDDKPFSIEETTLSMDLGVSIGTIRNSVNKLITIGWITKQREKFKGKWLPSTYTVNPYLKVTGQKHYDIKGNQL